MLSNNWQYLQNELARLRCLLIRHSLWLQARAAHPELIEADFYQENPEAQAISIELASLDSRCRQGFSQNDLPIKQLMYEFGLNAFEIQVVLLALAAELDSSFDGLLAQCQAAPRQVMPTVALALRLFCESAEAWVEARASFDMAGPLIRYGLLHLTPTDARLLSAAFHLDQRIVNHLLGISQPPAGLLPHIRLVGVLPDDQLIRTDLAVQLSALVRWSLSAQEVSGRVTVNLTGAAGAGKRTLAALACANLQLPVLAAAAPELVADNLLPLFLREAILQHAVAYLDCQQLPEESRPLVRQACLEGGRIIFIGTPARATWLETAVNDRLIPFEVPALKPGERQRLWQMKLGDVLNGQAGVLAARFPFTPGDIEQVRAAAHTRALVRSAASPQVTLADVWQAARTHPQHRLNELARRIEPHYTWDDIVLPDATRQELVELQQQVAHQTRVYETWGFGKRLSRGRGVSVLFSGLSGTGKTMAAEILAGGLEFELYRIDLSCVVSKYIGETEKNLARVFDEAETSGAILFFDEADALFGKRSEVKDSHDRYANIEINYLLQRMEDYQGLAILATNMRQALDEAFLRRLRFLIEFPLPDALLRGQIWRKSFPPETPLANIDFDFLASQFKITGGNIHNITLGAAFLAASQYIPVQMEHIIHATKREFDKIGKTCLESDFGPYFALVK